MISQTVYEALAKYVPTENILVQEPMSRHTTFRVGGNADCMVKISNKAQLTDVVRYINRVEYPYLILGNGSNLLVSDKGFEGIVLQIADEMSKVTVMGDTIIAQAGALMSQVAKTALEASLTGLEFASGITGTIGGGAVMNAGAYDGELSQVVETVTVLTKDGEELVFDNETMEFGYRNSGIKKHTFIIIEVKCKLKQGDKIQIRQKMDELSAKRREKQPLEYASAGSTFKRPEGHFAGKLIMDAGLSGYCVGDAQVSEKHCGFVINRGNATAKDVYTLIQDVKERVYDTSGVSLEPEIIFIGDF